MENNNNKVFGIGFHKTGTTSLAMALQVLGHNNCRGMSVLKKTFGITNCLKLLQNKDYAIIISTLLPFDSCQDNPWYVLYRELDEAWPNSKFILTIRDEEKWLLSCQKFFKDYEKPIHEWVYGVKKFPGNEHVYLNRYRQHNNEVQEYFKDRKKDLLIVNWELGHGWKEICSFLNKPLVKLPFPHRNKS